MALYLVLLWACTLLVGFAQCEHQIYMWGYNEFGELGDGTTQFRTRPELIDIKCHSLNIGVDESGCVNGTGHVWWWGRDGHTSYIAHPIHIPTPAECVTWNDGWAHRACITRAGKIFLWGLNANGQLGLGNTVTIEKPKDYTPVPGIVTEVTLNYHFSAVLTSTGEVYSFGSNSNGQMGDGTTTDRHSPVKAKFPMGVKCTSDIQNGFSHTGCLTADGTPYMWGSNGHGELGDGTTTDQHTPIQTPKGLKCAQLALGGYHSACLKEDGTLLFWGENKHGELGNDTYVKISTNPVEARLPNSETCAISTVSLSEWSSGCISTAGNLYMWGINHHGQVGDGTRIDRYSPVHIPLNPKCGQLALGGVHCGCEVGMV